MDAAVELFNEKGYGAPTREIAERADVSETLLFRHFGSKAGLFREAMISPFAEFVDSFVEDVTRRGVEAVDPHSQTLELVGALYDLFTSHRGVVAILWSATTTHAGSELGETGLIEEAWRSFDKLDDLGRRVGYGGPGRDEVATRAVVTMVAGMAVANRPYKGRRVPDRVDEVEEMTRICLYGYRERR